MIRAMIVDDEAWARANVLVLLEKNPEIELVGECESGEEAKRRIPELAPDLLFLDVQLTDCDGFEVLERLGTRLPAAVIFVTAYDRFALKAFEVAAVDYLLKPFENERFYRALDRAKEALNQRKPGGRLIVRSAGRIAFVRTSEIEWIEAADYYACLHLSGKTHMMRKTLGELEKELDKERFCRIHRSYIVNLDFVKGVRTDAVGEKEIVLGDGSALRLSRGYRAQFLERLSVVLE